MITLNTKLLNACLVALFIGQSVPSLADVTNRMQPVKDQHGHYSYPGMTTSHEHWTFYRGILALFAIDLSPSAWKTKLVTYWHGMQVQAPKSDPVAFLKPRTTVPEPESIELKITWVGHSSFLIQINGYNILVDPLWGDVKVGPKTKSRREMLPGIALDDLPRIDAIVISHNHPDHMCTPTLTYLAKRWQPIVYVPLGNACYVKPMGFERVVELNWWESMTYKQGDGRAIEFTCLPARHNPIRFWPPDCCKMLCCSWMIGALDKNIYFTGDTAYGPHFKQIGQHFPVIDVALMPIGPTDKEEGVNTHKDYHIDAKEAVDAFIDMRARCFVPMHYGTVFLGPDNLEYPVQRLFAYWQRQREQGALENKTLLFARCGVTYAMNSELGR